MIRNIADGVLSALRVFEWTRYCAAMQSGTAECFQAFVSRFWGDKGVFLYLNGFDLESKRGETI